LRVAVPPRSPRASSTPPPLREGVDEDVGRKARYMERLTRQVRVRLIFEKEAGSSGKGGRVVANIGAPEARSGVAKACLLVAPPAAASRAQRLRRRKGRIQVGRCRQKNAWCGRATKNVVK